MVTTIGMSSWRRRARSTLSIGLMMLLLASLLLSVPTTSAQTPAPWRGEYYNNTNLSGSPALVRMDAAINFDWGDNPPGSGVNSGYFSVRWTTLAYFDAATYTFNVTTDDGTRLWVDDGLILDEWRDQAKKSFSATKALSQGYHSIRLEYYDAGEQALVIFNWSPAGAGPGPMPSPGQMPVPESIPGPGPDPVPEPAKPQTIIVDELDSRFVWGGARRSHYSRGLGYREHLYWTWNSEQKLYSWGKWFPHIETAGDWEVYAYVASRYFGTTRASYAIFHNGVRDRRTIDQSRYSDQWVSLGTYYFGGGDDEYVLLSDVTGDSHATRYVGFDALKFVSSGGAPKPKPEPEPQLPCCAVTPLLGFGRVWNTYSAVRNGLGCPTEREKGTFATEKPFQDGLMFWRQDTGQTLVLHNNGTWQSYAGTWSGAEPAFVPSVMAPARWYQPGGGHGNARHAGPSMRGGPGPLGVRPFTASVQQFWGGSMLWSSIRGIYVLYDNGCWSRYD